MAADVINRHNISIHAPRAGSDILMCPSGVQGQISIHAPRAGSDSNLSPTEVNTEISIHAPRAGSDASARPQRCAASAFQSTLPVRGAT